MVIGTVTAVSASLVSCTVTVTDAPSATVWAAEAKLTSNGVGRSSSSIDTTLCAVVPAATPVGSVPNDRRTLSSSSSMSSWVAANENVLDVSPALNVTPAGTPE